MWLFNDSGVDMMLEWISLSLFKKIKLEMDSQNYQTNKVFIFMATLC